MATKKLPRPEKRCQEKRRDGKRCRAARLRDSEYCLWHHPWVERHREMRDKILDMPPQESSEIHEVLVEAVKAVKKGKLDAQQAYALGWLLREVRRNLPEVAAELAKHEREASMAAKEPEYGEPEEKGGVGRQGGGGVG